MDWNGLRIFLYVARHGNLVNAARALRLDPTTVSRRVSALETELQQTLFERTTGGFAPTAYGRTLLLHAEDMEQAANKVEVASANPQHLTGELRVSVSEGFGAFFISPRLKGFVAAHPQLNIDLVASNGFLNPSRREADLAILLTRPRRGALKTRKLADYSLGLYAPASFPEWHDPARLIDLQHGQVPIIGYIPDFIYAPELRYLDEIESGLKASVRSTSIIAQREMIAGGAGLGVLPCFMAEGDTRLVRIQSDKSIQRSFWLAVHQDIASQPRVRAFIDWLTHVVTKSLNTLEQKH